MILTEKVLSIISKITDDKTEQNIIKKSLKNYDNEDKLLYELYQFIGCKINNENFKNVKFKSNNFDNIKLKIEEKNNFIENPFQVEEGVLQCNKCGSSKVYSYQKQVRAGDEGTTTFAHCINCNSKWST